MNDLISIQAAIDEIDTLFVSDIREMAFIQYNHGIADSLATLKNLPSAQQWIPVSEKLPEEHQECLITINWGEDVSEGKNVYSVEKSSRSDVTYWKGFGRDKNVVAWMPLPEPYEGGNA